MESGLEEFEKEEFEKKVRAAIERFKKKGEDNHRQRGRDVFVHLKNGEVERVHVIRKRPRSR